MSFELRDKGLSKLHHALEEIGRAKILVGWQGPKGSQPHGDGPATHAEVAFWLEFGTKNMPARPMLAEAEARGRGDLLFLMQHLAPSLAAGSRTPGEVLDKMGEVGLNHLRSTIEDAPNWAAPLVLSTVAAKGIDTPLIDTGDLYESAEVVIQRGTFTTGVIPGAIGGSS